MALKTIKEHKVKEKLKGSKKQYKVLSTAELDKLATIKK